VHEYPNRDIPYAEDLGRRARRFSIGAFLIEELARSVPVLIWDNEKGDLVLSDAGTARGGSPLIESVNMEVAEATRSMDQRYSDIYVVTQGPVEGTDGFVGYFAHAKDQNTPPVPRKRVKLDHQWIG
jgi:hypothetical protein